MPATEWSLLAHPAFMTQLEISRQKMADAKAKAEVNWINHSDVKRHFTLTRMITEKIPQNPASADFRLGNALGQKYRLWFRAKFLQQYRIFFRYSSIRNIIVYAWVNDPATLRAYGSKTDAYQVFRKMLESGKVPNNWDELIAESKRLS
jgi:toxin YhaV